MTTKKRATKPRPDRAAEAAFADYLRQHPDFFERHSGLLEDLRVPHAPRGAVSLIERQRDLLRDSNNQLRARMSELVEVARDNDRVAERMQRLAVGLISTRDADELLSTVQGLLRDEFNADFTAIRIGVHATDLARLPHCDEFVGDDHPSLILIDRHLGQGRPVCGRLEADVLRSLFGDSARRVGSAALVPLRGGDWHGALAVGSRQRERFQPGLGTLFLERMGTLISQALQGCLDHTPRYAAE